MISAATTGYTRNPGNPTESKNFAAPGNVNTNTLSRACEIHIAPSERRRRNAPHAMLRASASESRIRLSVFMIGISGKYAKPGRADARPGWLMLCDHCGVTCFERQSPLLPLLLAAFVDRNVGIAELDQALRGDAAVLAAPARAIHDDGRGLVRNDRRRTLIDLIMRK